MNTFQVKDKAGNIYQSITEYSNVKGISFIDAIKLMKKEIFNVPTKLSGRKGKPIDKKIEIPEKLFKEQDKEYPYPYHVSQTEFKEALQGEKVEKMLKNRNKAMIDKIFKYKKDIGKLPIKSYGHKQQLIPFTCYKRGYSKILIVLNPK